MTALEDLSRFDADLLTTPSMVLSLLVLSEKLFRAHELNSVALVSNQSREKEKKIKIVNLVVVILSQIEL